MRKIFYFILTGLFLFWLMPLGRFIDRAHERQACGGQRAICLCSANFAAASGAKAEQAHYSHAGGHHQQRASGAASHDLEMASAFCLRLTARRPVVFESVFLYALLVEPSIETIPKT